jgi:hypothetical protein
MNGDTLDRERDINNIIDWLGRLEERVRRIEERLQGAVSESGRLLVPEEDTNHLWALVIRQLGSEEGEWPVLHQVRAR